MNYQYVNNELWHYGVNFLDLAKKYGTPLKIRYIPAIKENILSLKDCFQRAIKKYGYPKEYIYANANKANYYAEVIKESITYADVIEASSYVDLLMTEATLKKLNLCDKYILCNGIKSKEYLQEIVSAHNRGVKVIPIFDSLDEYHFFERASFDSKLLCGIRVNIKNVYEDEADRVRCDRFGFIDAELEKLTEKIDKNRFSLVMLHYHQRADLFFEEKALYNMKYVFEEYFVPLKKLFPSLQIFNLGGGVPYSDTEKAYYLQYADNIVGTLFTLSKKYNIEPPYIMQENGRYTVSNSMAYIFEVISQKTIDGVLWYTVNSSLISTLPNAWALKSAFKFLPVNLANNEIKEVCLAGCTCDCDDVYYYQAKNKRVNMPAINHGEALYIAAFGVGAYQEFIPGGEGIYHCLLQAPAEVIIFEEENTQRCILKKELQSVQEIFTKLRF